MYFSPKMYAAYVKLLNHAGVWAYAQDICQSGNTLCALCDRGVVERRVVNNPHEKNNRVQFRTKEGLGWHS